MRRSSGKEEFNWDRLKRGQDDYNWGRMKKSQARVPEISIEDDEEVYPILHRFARDGNDNYQWGRIGK